MEIKIYQSGSHLVSAAMAADRAKNIERDDEQDKEEPGDYADIPPIREHSAMVQSCIMSSFAYLESYINEVWDVIEHRESVKNFKDFNGELTSNRDLTRYETLAKHQALLVAANRETFQRGEAPFQEVDWLRHLRNYWVHYEPETISTVESPKDEDSKLGSALRDRIEPSPMYGDENETFLPRLVLSYDCCKWCIDSVIEFNEEYRSKVGDPRRHHHDRVRSILDAS